MQKSAGSHEGRSADNHEVTLTLSTYDVAKLELAADALEALATTSWGTRQRVFRRMLGLGRLKNPDPEHQVQMQSKLFSAADLIRKEVLGIHNSENDTGSPPAELAPPPSPPDTAHPDFNS